MSSLLLSIPLLSLSKSLLLKLLHKSLMLPAELVGKITDSDVSTIRSIL
jgi:hypothetical protein